MKKTDKNKLSVTVGIPTCYGGLSLVPVIKSIRDSKYVNIDNILVITDRKPIPEDIKREIEKMGARIIWNEKEGSHHSKLQQMINTCGTDILVAICDDIILHPLAVSEVLKVFAADEKVSLVSSAIMPLPPETFFEGVLGSSVRIPEMIVRFWNNGDNYLSVSGRCMSFRNDLIKKLRFPPQLVNNDQFIYLENKYNGGRNAHAPRSIAYIRPPQYLKDHMRPSSRFQLGEMELQNYFKHDISKEFKIPIFAGLKAALIEFSRHPITGSLYLLVFIYTRIARKDPGKIMTTYWERDMSTKNI